MTNLWRRRWLLGAGSLSLAATPLLRAGEVLRTAPRIVVVGGGWGGLAAAVRLRQRLSQADITVIEKQGRFFSLPLSNRVLAGVLDPALLRRDYMQAARRHGWRHWQGVVSAIDRQQRTVSLGDQRIPYDYLVLAVGLGPDYSAWFGDDHAGARMTQTRFGAAWHNEDEFLDLERRLAAFTGGKLLMNLPAMPMRCPPAPYERAIALAHRFRQQGIRGRITLLDPGPGALGFRQLFADYYADVITHVPHAPIVKLDPQRRVASTDFADYAFDEAILMPPQAANSLLTESGLAENGWGAQDPSSLQALGDERIFIVGDAVGKVSPLFGHYVKSGHVAAQLGIIAAEQIAARLAGTVAPELFPEAICHVLTGLAPEAALRIEARYRRRGDGVITQETRQQRDAQPRGEAQAWLDGMLEQWF